MKVRDLIQQLSHMDPDATPYLEADDFGCSISEQRVLLKIEGVEGKGAGCGMEVRLIPEIPVRAAQPTNPWTTKHKLHRQAGAHPTEPGKDTPFCRGTGPHQSFNRGG